MEAYNVKSPEGKSYHNPITTTHSVSARQAEEHKFLDRTSYLSPSSNLLHYVVMIVFNGPVTTVTLKKNPILFLTNDCRQSTSVKPLGCTRLIVPKPRIRHIKVTLLIVRHDPALQRVIRSRRSNLNNDIAAKMIDDSSKSVWSISPVLERYRNPGLIVFRVVFAV